jgi:hypothetical protein
MEGKNHFSAEGHEARNKAIRGNSIVKKEYDFSKGERGKFYRTATELNIPVHLEPDVAKVVQERAKKKRSDIGAEVNEWLRNDIRTGAKRAG